MKEGEIDDTIIKQKLIMKRNKGRKTLRDQLLHCWQRMKTEKKEGTKASKGQHSAVPLPCLTKGFQFVEFLVSLLKRLGGPRPGWEALRSGWEALRSYWGPSDPAERPLVPAG